MLPPDFFQTAKVDARIRYGTSDAPIVTVDIINRGGMWAWGTEEGTMRRVWLYLRDGLLVDDKRGSFTTLDYLGA